MSSVIWTCCFAPAVTGEAPEASTTDRGDTQLRNSGLRVAYAHRHASAPIADRTSLPVGIQLIGRTL